MAAPAGVVTLGDDGRDATLGGDARVAASAVEATPEQRAVAGLRRLLGATQVLGTTVAIQGLGVCTGALAAHMLGVDGRGQLAAVLLWATIIGYLGDLGLPLAYVYETARDRTQIPALIGNAFLITLAQWLGLFALGSAVLLLMLRPFGGNVAAIGELYLFLVLPLHLNRYLLAIAHGERDYSRLNTVRLSTPVAYLLALLACFVAGRTSVGWVAACSLFSIAVTTAVSVRLVLPASVRTLGRPRLDRALLRRTLGYGLRAHVGNLTPVDSLQVDLMLVVALLGAHDAGLYAVALSATIVVRTPANALSIVTLAEVAATRDADEQRRRLGALARLSACSMAVTALPLMLLARPLLTLVYGHPYAPAAPLLQILALGTTAAAMRQVLGDALRAAGRPAIPTMAEVASWPAGAVALLVLMPRYGAAGAAWAVSAAYLAALAVNVALARELGLSPRGLLLPGRDDVLMARAVLAGLLRRVRPRPSGAAS